MQKYYCYGMKFYGDKVPLKWYNNLEEDVLFVGLYFQVDYNIFSKHKGKKIVFWNGSDVSRLLYNIKWQKILKNDLKNNNTLHYCHNIKLKDELLSIGIESVISPVLFNSKDDYPPSYKPSDILEFYMSAHQDRELEYGVPIFIELASFFPNCKFHIYGIDELNEKNIIYHGQISEKIMDEEIKNYQGCLRMNKHDGESQIVMKSKLLGLHTILDYDLNSLINKIVNIDFDKPQEFNKNDILDINEFIEIIKN